MPGWAERRVVVTLPFFAGVCGAVSQSELLALVPHQFAERMAGRLGLETYRPPMPIDPVRLSMIWHRRSTSNHEWLRQRIAAILLPLEATPPNP